MTTEIGFTAPHAKASEIGLEILAQGGTAIDAMIAGAAAISVLYPHMNSLAGDGFWLIQRPNQEPVCIDGCGQAAALATIDFYREQGLEQIPSRGPLGALTIGGTLASWQTARQYAQGFSKPMDLASLLAPAIALAEDGVEVTQSLQHASEKVHQDMAGNAEYFKVFEPNQRTLKAKDVLKNPKLGRFLSELAEQGLDSFYNGAIGDTLAQSLEAAGSPIRRADLHQFTAKQQVPLQLTTRKGKFYNLPAPTQGVASLLILGIYDKIYQPSWTEAERIHGLIEATKQAFLQRDAQVTDPRRLKQQWQTLLTDQFIADLASNISEQALDWPRPSAEGDTVWMGCVDSQGTMVSFIQSIYWEFGSGVLIPEYGLVWNNRGTSFSLDPQHINSLQAGYKPFHTLNPAMAELADGRRLSYGTMGGEGQPQTQAAIINRYLYEGLPLQEAINKARWLLGRTWGSNEHDLKIEQNLYAELAADFTRRGHQIKSVDDKNELMGHAGAVVLHASGQVEAASDWRSDGQGLTAKVQG